jgi:hypothetical protein
MAMPNDEFDQDDPMELVGVALPDGDPDELARSIVEEFIRMGLSDQELLHLFHDPFYAGLHAIWQGRGDAYVQDLIAYGRKRWGYPRFTTKE